MSRMPFRAETNANGRERQLLPEQAARPNGVVSREGWNGSPTAEFVQLRFPVVPSAGIDSSTCVKWAKQLKKLAPSSLSLSGRIVHSVLLDELKKEASRMKKSPTAADLVSFVKEVTRRAEQQYVREFSHGKARSLDDTCGAWTLRLLDKIAEAEQLETLDRVVTELSSDASPHTKVRARTADSHGGVLDALGRFADGTADSRSKIMAALPADAAGCFRIAVSDLLLGPEKWGGLGALKYSDAVRTHLQARKKGEIEKASPKELAAHKSSVLSALSTLEEDIVRQCLPEAIKVLRCAHRENPGCSFELVAHVAECLFGALDNGTSLSSLPTFAEILGRVGASAGAAGFRVEASTIEQVQLALRAVSPKLRSRSIFDSR